MIADLKTINKYFSGILLLTQVVVLFSCNDFKKNRTHQGVPDSNITKGKHLATIYCQSCHLLPDPSLLDAKHWETGVIPGMGPRLGIFDYGFNHYPSSRNDISLDRNYYPSKPVIGTQDWQYIIDYYTSVSPDSLPQQQRKYLVKKSADLFNLEIPDHLNNIPTTCFVQIDTLSSPRRIVISDMISKNIFHFNKSGRLIDSFHNISPVVDIEKQEESIIACNVGIMKPNNGKYGSIVRLSMEADGKLKVDSTLKLTNLARPVQVSPVDLNKDGKTDYLICEFGNLTGALSWVENSGNNQYRYHVLRAAPGAIKAYIDDVNHDGLADIWALFAQGDEGLFLFTNEGNGKFKQEEVLRFQSIAGSSYFEFADFNHDGHPDILYTCGDNADYSLVLKPYHGVYIYLNDGSNHFKQAYFFPMHGCFKAMARDFDGDGNLDIAAISFFADYVHHPEESFIYLENKGNLDFQPYTIPGTNVGRWLTMDAADLDGDGKKDIILGNFSLGAESIPSSKNWKDGPPFIVLKNIIKK